jgi:hypothetical protein
MEKSRPAALPTNIKSKMVLFVAVVVGVFLLISLLVGIAAVGGLIINMIGKLLP